MSYRVELERFGAVVTVETVTEVRDLLEAIYPRLEISGSPRGLGHLLDEADRIERGLLELMKDGPRRLDDLATGGGLGRTTALEYLKRLAADGKAHQEGRGPATRWAVGPKEEP